MSRNMLVAPMNASHASSVAGNPNRLRYRCALLALSWLVPSSAFAQTPQTYQVFVGRCGSCHAATSSTATRAPSRRDLGQRTPELILDAITTGTMAPHARGLNDTQMRELAVMLAGRPFGAAKSRDADAMPNRCSRDAAFADSLDGPQWNGWGADVENSRAQSAAFAALPADAVPRLTLKWAFGFPGGESAYGQPTVVGSRVYIGSDNGFVYSLDAATGCVYWSFHAQAGVRTAISIGRIGTGDSERAAAYFGDLKANVYAIDAASGRQIWMQRADEHALARITGAPTLWDGRLYVPIASTEELVGGHPQYECCTFRGSVVAYDAADGKVLWRQPTIAQPLARTGKTSTGTQLWGPAGAAIWSAPTIDAHRSLIYIATGDAYTAPAAPESDAVMALDLATGRGSWTRQLTSDDAFVWPCERDNFSETCPSKPGPDFDFGMSPMLRHADGRDLIIIGQKSGAAWALDPDKNGAILWQHRVGKGSWDGGLMWGGAADDRRAYFPNVDSYYGPETAGGLAALDLATGEQAWFTRPPARSCGDVSCSQPQSAAVTVIPGVVFSGSTNGIMRAYRTTDGAIVWEYDTAQRFTTVNGVDAHGGSLDGPGPTIVNGMLFLSSGYAAVGGRKPGNVLLAFAVP
ncbi:MAG TPA: PQQ-binding-like beta-propeller repeat protein [Vicinamibacterales bacterium]|nr:PQQ-binding-like beta-propeller repeat protein [Vicinamibacterales bacterium]